MSRERERERGDLNYEISGDLMILDQIIQVLDLNLPQLGYVPWIMGLLNEGYLQPLKG